MAVSHPPTRQRTNAPSASVGVTRSANMCVQGFLQATVGELHIQVDCISSFCLGVLRGEHKDVAAATAETRAGVAQLQDGFAALQLTPEMQTVAAAVKAEVQEFQQLVQNELEELRGNVRDEYLEIGLRKLVHGAFSVPKSDKVRPSTTLAPVHCTDLICGALRQSLALPSTPASRVTPAGLYSQHTPAQD